jgi:hypothetical protein
VHLDVPSLEVDLNNQLVISMAALKLLAPSAEIDYSEYAGSFKM